MTSVPTMLANPIVEDSVVLTDEDCAGTVFTRHSDVSTLSFSCDTSATHSSVLSNLDYSACLCDSPRHYPWSPAHLTSATCSTDNSEELCHQSSYEKAPSVYRQLTAATVVRPLLETQGPPPGCPNEQQVLHPLGYSPALALLRLSVRIPNLNPEDIPPGFHARVKQLLVGVAQFQLAAISIRKGSIQLALDLLASQPPGGMHAGELVFGSIPLSTWMDQLQLPLAPSSEVLVQLSSRTAPCETYRARWCGHQQGWETEPISTTFDGMPTITTVSPQCVFIPASVAAPDACVLPADTAAARTNFPSPADAAVSNRLPNSVGCSAQPNGVAAGAGHVRQPQNSQIQQPLHDGNVSGCNTSQHSLHTARATSNPTEPDTTLPAPLHCFQLTVTGTNLECITARCQGQHLNVTQTPLSPSLHVSDSFGSPPGVFCGAEPVQPLLQPAASEPPAFRRPASWPFDEACSGSWQSGSLEGHGASTDKSRDDTSACAKDFGLLTSALSATGSEVVPLECETDGISAMAAVAAMLAGEDCLAPVETSHLLDLSGCPASPGMLLLECWQGQLLSNYLPVLVVDDAELADELTAALEDPNFPGREGFIVDLAFWLQYAATMRGRASVKANEASTGSATCTRDGAAVSAAVPGTAGPQADTFSSRVAPPPAYQASTPSYVASRTAQQQNTCSSAATHNTYQSNVSSFAATDGHTAEFVSSAASEPSTDTLLYQARMVSAGLRLLMHCVDSGWHKTACRILSDFTSIGYPYPLVLQCTMQCGDVTLLHRAVRSASPVMVDALVQLGHEHNHPWTWMEADNIACLTPLHLAAVLQDGGSLARHILDTHLATHAAWLYAKDMHGLTPAQYAAQAGLQIILPHEAVRQAFASARQAVEQAATQIRPVQQQGAELGFAGNRTKPPQSYGVCSPSRHLSTLRACFLLFDPDLEAECMSHKKYGPLMVGGFLLYVTLALGILLAKTLAAEPLTHAIGLTLSFSSTAIPLVALLCGYKWPVAHQESMFIVLALSRCLVKTLLGLSIINFSWTTMAMLQRGTLYVAEGIINPLCEQVRVPYAFCLNFLEALASGLLYHKIGLHADWASCMQDAIGIAALATATTIARECWARSRFLAKLHITTAKLKDE